MSSHDPELLKQAASKRTNHIAVAVEDLYQPHNASSIIRSCDAFGVQNLYTINRRNLFQTDPLKSQHLEKFITRHDFFGPNATQKCFSQLKEKGYRIAATSLRPGCIELKDLPVEQPIALCFGTEEKGLSQVAHDLADDFIRIPMFGMTQSFNVSVTVALSLQILTQKNPTGFAPLVPEETGELLDQWNHNG